MYWYSDQSDPLDPDEFIVLKIKDSKRDAEVWFRFFLYFGDCFGDRDTEYPSIPVSTQMICRASISFVPGIDYQVMADVRRKVAQMYPTPPEAVSKMLLSLSLPSLAHPVQKFREYCAADFAEMLSLRIGEGIGNCTPQDLCNIWRSTPMSDRRLFELWFYEHILPHTGGGGICVGYIVLLINGSSDLSSYVDWWVRLERTNSIDHATISQESGALIHPESKLRDTITFDGGVPFENVIDALQNAPIELNPLKDSFYASTIAHRISIQLSNGLAEFTIKGLKRMWCGEHAREMQVNRVISFQEYEGPRGSSEFLLLNISPGELDRRGLWVRLGNSMDEHKGSVCIARDRRCVMKKGSNVTEDVAFEGLEFGHVLSDLGPISTAMCTKKEREIAHRITPDEIIKKLSEKYQCMYRFK
ncbi:unnamed protein product [Rhizoctonia solani]|uniref:Uncharacterized protein n=1 Tax=Rhizoctonia solani TaxID=456999 RepID=A0A8H2WHP4_9AGAM|nr:unnamed protein product [Rhizoctonia solani]